MARLSSTCLPDETSGAAHTSQRDLGDWIGWDFFERRVQRCKQPPIAWHVVSPERRFEARVLYYERNQVTLQTLHTKCAGRLIDRPREQQANARERGSLDAVGEPQLKIQDAEEFRPRLVAIERRDALGYRVSCRWKGGTETGRPGPYTPEIDDGVKVSIRPLQEAGLLAAREVIKKC